MTLEFPGDSVTPQPQTPESLRASAEQWLELAAPIMINLADAVISDAKVAAFELLSDLQSKLDMVRLNLAEGIALEAARKP